MNIPERFVEADGGCKVEHYGHVVQHTRLDDVVDAEVTLVLNVTLNHHQLAVKVRVLGARRHEQLDTHRQTDRQTDKEVNISPP